MNKVPRMLHEPGIGDQGICNKKKRLCSSSAYGSPEFSNQTDVNTFPIELLNSYVQKDRKLKAMCLTPYVAKCCI